MIPFFIVSSIISLERMSSVIVKVYDLKPRYEIVFHFQLAQVIVWEELFLFSVIHVRMYMC